MTDRHATISEPRPFSPRATLIAQKSQQFQKWQAEDREMIALDTLEKLNSDRLQPIGSDRG
jgi:hypothetical protein